MRKRIFPPVILETIVWIKRSAGELHTYVHALPRLSKKTNGNALSIIERKETR